MDARPMHRHFTDGAVGVRGPCVDCMECDLHPVFGYLCMISVLRRFSHALYWADAIRDPLGVYLMFFRSLLGSIKG